MNTLLNLLHYYNEIESSDPDSELLQLKTDVDRALAEAPLDEEERALIERVFLTEPTAYPMRGRVDKNGGQSGRPPGGVTQGIVAKLMIEEDKSANAKNIKATRILKRAVEKLAIYLGEGYVD